MDFYDYLFLALHIVIHSADMLPVVSMPIPESLWTASLKGPLLCRDKRWRNLRAGTEPCEDLIIRAEPPGGWIPEANRPSSILGWTHCVPGVVSGSNCAYPILLTV